MGGHTMRKRVVWVAFGAMLSVAVSIGAATFNLFSPATGILKGSANSYVTTAAAASDVYGLWSGGCNSTKFLRGDGACADPLLGANGSASAPTHSYSGDTNNGDYLIGTDNVGTATAGVLRMSITSAGNVLVGNSNTAIATSGTIPALQMIGTSASGSSFVFGRFSNDATGAGGMKIVKSRGASVGTFAATVLDDGIGGFNWQADDGTDVTSTSVQMDAFVDGAVSTGIVPGRLRIRTTNTSGSTVDAITFNSSQQALHANGTAALPTVAFTGSSTSGFYRKAANDIGLSIAGALAWNLNSTAMTSAVPAIITAGTSAALPGLRISAARAVQVFTETGVDADEGQWFFDVDSEVWKLRTLNDANNTARDIISVTRSGSAVGTISLGNATDNNAATFLGTGTVTVNGDLKINTAGKGLSVKEGSNAKMGTCTLVIGVCVVSTTAVAATSRVFLTIQSLGTVVLPKTVGVTARTAATSFTITSEDATDTSVIAWLIVDPS
jgi:hypothetical protein